MATVIYGDFEWDEDKAAMNIAKHAVTFDEATTALMEPYSLEFADPVDPDNVCTLAALPDGRILHVVTTIASQRIRIISARRATRYEERRYQDDPG